MRYLEGLARTLTRTWRMDVRAIGGHLLLRDAEGWWAVCQDEVIALDVRHFASYDAFVQATEPCDEPEALQLLARQLGAPVGGDKGAPVYYPA